MAKGLSKAGREKRKPKADGKVKSKQPAYMAGSTLGSPVPGAFKTPAKK